MMLTAHNPAEQLARLIRWLYMLLLASLPFSVGTSIGTHQIELPSEPLTLVLALLLLIWYLRYERDIPSLLQSPISRLGILYLGWMGISSLFSEYPLVSFKYWLVSAAHWWVYFAGFFVLAKAFPKDIFRLLTCYALPFGLIMIYAWTVHAQYDFRIDVSVLTARPFYFDHAMYSCCLLLLLGLYIIWACQPLVRSGLSKQMRYLATALALVFSIAVYLSFSRAAWLSALLSLCFLGLTVVFRLSFKGWLILLSTSIIALILFWSPISSALGSNQAESKNHGFLNQIISTTNISTDVSNLERINRYSCAWRMFKDRPISGFGPGTYQFAYLPYQREEEMTRISVTTTGPHGPGRGGGAHSEYLQALSEMGLLGLLIWLGLAFASIYAGLAIFFRKTAAEGRWLGMGLLLGLMTYFLHGFFNNFLHHGKVAALVWIMLAALVVLRKEVPADTAVNYLD